jgi:hypothetical protein
LSVADVLLGDRLSVLSFSEFAGVAENLDRPSGVPVLLCSDGCSERNYVIWGSIVVESVSPTAFITSPAGL